MSVYSGELDITQIKVRDIFYECEYGQCLKLIALSEPVRSEDGEWTWRALSEKGNEIDYMVNEKYANYGPKLYSYNPYKPFVVDKNSI